MSGSSKSAKDFFRPLAVGAPEPLREIPARPSRAIHFFDPSNEKMAAKIPDMVGNVDVLLGNLEDAIKADNKVAAREGLVRIAQGHATSGTDPALDPDQRARQPVGARRPDHAGPRDRRQARRDHGAEGAGRRGHPLRRPAAGPARGQGRPRPADPGARDPRDRPRRRERRGDLRRQPAHAGPLPRPGRPRRGPADEDHPGRRRPPRLPGPPGPADAATASPTSRPTGRRTSRTSGTTRSPGWSTPARCTASTPTTGRSATSPTWWRARTSSATRSCSAASAPGRLHPKQIAIANRVFSPSVEDVAHARRVVAAMGDGTGAVMLDGKMEDDASLKQCLVMVELAEQLAAIDPELEGAVRRHRGRRDDATSSRPRRSVLYMPSSNERAAGEGQDASPATG